MATREDKIVTGIKCPKCKDFIWSRHRHDYRSCTCGYCQVDGGQDYLKIGYGYDVSEEKWEIPTISTREVSLTRQDKELLQYVPY
jgi:hypothetical protein